MIRTLIAIAAALILVLLARWAIQAVLGKRRRGQSGSDSGESSADVIEHLEPIIHPHDGDGPAH